MRQTFAVVPERIIIGTNSKALTGTAVVISDGLIADLLPVEQLRGNLEVVRYERAALLPGFIDAHVHLDRWMLPHFLAHGITTVRDTGNNLKWITALRRQMGAFHEAGPYVECTGPVLDQAEYRHANISWGMRTGDDVRRAIDVLQAHGIRQLKLYWDLPEPLFSQAVAYAKKCGMHTLADLKLLTLDTAIDAGLQEFEHLHGMPREFSDDILDRILGSGIVSVPTINVYSAVIDYFCNSEAQALAEHIPETIRTYWEESFIRRWQRNNEGLPMAYRDHMANKVGLNRRYLKELIRRGGKLGIGTDSPCTSFPGFSYALELREFRDAGMDVLDIIQTATGKNAELLGIADKTGTIEIGKRADLQIRTGNPEERFEVLQGLADVVYKGGEAFYPAQLRKQALQGEPAEETLAFSVHPPSRRICWEEYLEGL